MRQLMILTVVLGVAGCAATDLFDRVVGSNVGEASVRTTARAVDEYCQLHGGNVAERSSTLQRINDQTTVGDVVAFDCDSDGAPDVPDDSDSEGAAAH